MICRSLSSRRWYLHVITCQQLHGNVPLTRKHFPSFINAVRTIHGKSGLFVHPDPNHDPTLTLGDIIHQFATLVGFAKDYGGPESIKAALENRKKLVDLLPTNRNELPERTMKDSFVTAIVPLRTNNELRDRYTTFDGSVRVGRILEDLDVFAGWCTYKHILNPRAKGFPNPYSCVTALVDCIHMSGKPINPNQDIRLSGHVSWVGKSSMEVQMLVDQKNEAGEYQFVTMAVFVFVARDPLNRGPAMVNPLVGNTEAEKQYILQGEERSRQRKLAAEESLIQKPPNKEEREIIHQLFLSTLDPAYGYFRQSALSGAEAPQCVSKCMSDARLNTLMLCHPQNRNRFNKVFGGFIMRQAFELAFSNVLLYCKHRPFAIAIDDILFRRPVEVGSVLRFGAEIGYVEDRYVHTPVIAEVFNPVTGKSEVTNIFQITFKTPDNVEPPPPIIPNTYQEAMMYLDCRRHFKEMVKGKV